MRYCASIGPSIDRKENAKGPEIGYGVAVNSTAEVIGT